MFILRIRGIVHTMNYDPTPASIVSPRGSQCLFWSVSLRDPLRFISIYLVTKYALTTELKINVTVMSNNNNSTTKLIAPLKPTMQPFKPISIPPVLKESFTLVVDSNKNTSMHIAFLQNLHDKVDVYLAHLLETSNFSNTKNKHNLSFLHIASARGNVELVQEFIEAGAKVNEYTNKDCPVYPNYTALQFACDGKSLETIKVLVKSGKVIGSCSEGTEFQSTNQQNIMQLHKNSSNDHNALSLLHLACIEDNPGVIDCFLDKHADVNEQADRDATYCPLYTPMHFAVEFNCKGNVKSLLENGADVTLRNGFCMTPLHMAMYYSHAGENNKILELLHDAVKDKKTNTMDANGLTYLHIAAAMNDLKTVKKLLALEADINQAVLPNLRNYSNYTPLHFAVKFVHQKMAKLLVSRGAQLNTIEGPTPLQIACEIGKTSLVQFLVKHSADAKVVDSVTGKTMLQLLVQNFVMLEESSTDFKKFSELSECIGLLVKCRVDVDAKDNDGNTVLHVACKEIRQSELCIEELLDCGADVNIKNNEGKTPLDLAWENNLDKECNYEGLAMLYHHVQKIKDLGLKVDERNEEFCRILMERRSKWSKNSDWDLYEDIYDDGILEAARQKRLEEIEKLKKVQIDEEVSLYDFLTMDEGCASEYVRSEGFKKVVEDPDGFWVKYPSYAYLIRIKKDRMLSL